MANPKACRSRAEYRREIGRPVYGRVWPLALDVLGLGSLFTRHNVEDDLLALIQRLEPSPHNRRMMHEDIRPALLHDEAEPMSVIEPLYFATGHSFPLPSV